MKGKRPSRQITARSNYGECAQQPTEHELHLALLEWRAENKLDLWTGKPVLTEGASLVSLEKLQSRRLK